MARRSIEERISQLEAQRKTLQARLGKQDRAKDTRRKILLGALVLYRLEKSDDEEFSKGPASLCAITMLEPSSAAIAATLMDNLSICAGVCIV